MIAVQISHLCSPRSRPAQARVLLSNVAQNTMASFFLLTRHLAVQWQLRSELTRGGGGRGRTHARIHAHHHAWCQGWPLPVVVTVRELEVEQQGTVCRRVQAVSVHQHLEAQTAPSIEARRVHHAYGKG